MAGYERTQSKELYTLVARVKVSYCYDNLSKVRRPQSYSVTVGAESLGFKYAKKVFKKLLEQIEDTSLVELRVINSPEEFAYGSTKIAFNIKGISEIYYFYVLSEDIEKIDSEPIHIICMGEYYPNDKEDFIKMIKAVSK